VYNKKEEGMMDNKFISAIDIVKKYGLSYQTVNYYTNLGLLEVLENQGNKRLYDRRDVEERLGKITDLKRRGYPLRLIRDEILRRN